METTADHIEEEAKAFDERILSRTRTGYIPDLRDGIKCDYFYKSFWRDPYFTRLYAGAVVDIFLDLLRRHAPNNAQILDVGCGPGYVSLELARNGYHVKAFDISSACIETANQTLAGNRHRDGFGSLEYSVLPMHEAKGTYDVVLFSGALHHIPDLAGAVKKAKELCKPSGVLICHEPCHDRWRLADASQVALIRGLLALTGYWFDPDEFKGQLDSEAGLLDASREVLREYVEERDKNEVGQSPHDNESDGTEMRAALMQEFDVLDDRPGFAFIYRTLGGIRGSDEQVHKLADMIAAYDRMAVANGIMEPNTFFFAGRPK